MFNGSNVESTCNHDFCWGGNTQKDPENRKLDQILHLFGWLQYPPKKNNTRVFSALKKLIHGHLEGQITITCIPLMTILVLSIRGLLVSILNICTMNNKNKNAINITSISLVITSVIPYPCYLLLLSLLLYMGLLSPLGYSRYTTTAINHHYTTRNIHQTISIIVIIMIVNQLC